MRWVPEHCLEYRQAPAAGDTGKHWNDSYQRGFRAIQRGEYDVAEAEMCRAIAEMLLAAGPQGEPPSVRR